MNLNQFKEVLVLVEAKTKVGDDLVDVVPSELDDSFVVVMPRKWRLSFLLLGGSFVSGHRIGFDKGIVTCVSPEAKTYFSLENVVAISNAPFLAKEKK